MTTMYAIYDTETNGLPDKNYSFENVHVTQFAFIITDGTRNYIRKEYLIKEDYEISDFITELTGITREKVDKDGIRFAEAWRLFNAYLEEYNCEYIIAHNANFDTRVMKAAYKRMKTNSNSGSYPEIDMTLFNDIKSRNIFTSAFINLFKYSPKLLVNIDIILKNNTSNDMIAEDIKLLINIIKEDYRNYGEKFFRMIHADSLPYYRKLYPSREKKIHKLLNHKLETIHNHIVGPYVQTHTALDDCYMLQNCINKTNFKLNDFIFA